MNTPVEQRPGTLELTGKDVKCVIWDLDNTLWEGTLAEGDEVTLRPGIRALLAELDRRGILLSIASKNSHDDAMARLRALGVDHYFLYPQISWNAKSVGVGRIQQALNIGLDTLLFIDDQPFERDEVQLAHPTVRCLGEDCCADLLRQPCLSPRVVTEDARRRRLMYLEDMARRQDEETYQGAPEAFLATLEMSFTIGRAGPDDLLRAEELTVRTNQLNSTGIGYGMAELSDLMNSPDHQLLICELTDRYGSYGKIGLALVERREDWDLIRLLLMSCRTLSRGVGSVLLTFLMKQAARDGRRLRADFRRTERNRQMLVTYQFSGFREIDRQADGQILFEHDLSQIQDYPAYIRIQDEVSP